uniref:Tc1-like transposase DDE domain-containing protein n=1 Tax=Acrobeloides nanus TaxID=290746 RepID=A0A914CDA8_9BILA
MDLVITTKKMNSAEYKEVLDLSLIPYLEEHGDMELKFQRDNAPIHVIGETMEWFEEHGVDIFDHPSCSPDLNPMENLWGILVREVYAKNRQYDDVETLQNAIVKAWDNINDETLQNLTDSMKNRVYQVIERGRGVTDY